LTPENAPVDGVRDWVPALRHAAPRLHAADDALLAIIVSAERDVQRRAGMLARRLHDAQPALPWPELSTAKLEQFDRLKPAAAALLEPRTLDRTTSVFVIQVGVSRSGYPPAAARGQAFPGRSPGYGLGTRPEVRSARRHESLGEVEVVIAATTQPTNACARSRVRRNPAAKAPGL
jgi:hypothetical protein